MNAAAATLAASTRRQREGGGTTMNCKERLQSYLDGQHVAYTLQEHVVAYDAQHVAQSEHIPGRMVAKVVIVRANGNPVLLALPADRRVDFDRVRALLHTDDLQLAAETEVAALFPDCAVGAMPPFGNLYHLPVVVDQRLAENEDVVFPAGAYTETIRLRADDFVRLVQPVVADTARHP
jgi:Ala-tRNA(Pro) deacylase